MIAECVAYTFEQSRLNCTLHTSTAKGQKFFRGKQTGLKKANYTLSLPEISYCSDKNRKRRCRREPKCSHVDCFRIASDFTRLSVPTLTSHFRLYSMRGVFRWSNAFWELYQSKNGYDAGFIKDEFDCVTDKCECARFDQVIIGKKKRYRFSLLSWIIFRWYCNFWKHSE